MASNQVQLEVRVKNTFIDVVDDLPPSEELLSRCSSVPIWMSSVAHSFMSTATSTSSLELALGHADKDRSVFPARSPEMANEQNQQSTIKTHITDTVDTMPPLILESVSVPTGKLFASSTNAASAARVLNQLAHPILCQSATSVPHIESSMLAGENLGQLQVRVNNTFLEVLDDPFDSSEALPRTVSLPIRNALGAAPLISATYSPSPLLVARNHTVTEQSHSTATIHAGTGKQSDQRTMPTRTMDFSDTLPPKMPDILLHSKVETLESLTYAGRSADCNLDCLANHSAFEQSPFLNNTASISAEKNEPRWQVRINKTFIEALDEPSCSEEFLPRSSSTPLGMPFAVGSLMSTTYSPSPLSSSTHHRVTEKRNSSPTLLEDNLRQYDQTIVQTPLMDTADTALPRTFDKTSVPAVGPLETLTEFAHLEDCVDECLAKNAVRESAAALIHDKGSVSSEESQSKVLLRINKTFIEVVDDSNDSVESLLRTSSLPTSIAYAAPPLDHGATERRHSTTISLDAALKDPEERAVRSYIWETTDTMPRMTMDSSSVSTIETSESPTNCDNLTDHKSCYSSAGPSLPQSNANLSFGTKDHQSNIDCHSCEHKGDFCGDQTSLVVVPACVTTLMLCNLPSKLSQEGLAEAIDQLGFAGTYDIVYIPRGTNNYVGYGFINFRTPEIASCFSYAISGFSFCTARTKRQVQVVIAKDQGLKATLASIKKGSNFRKRSHAPLMFLPAS